MAGFGPGAAVGLAVSGGSDSLAMLHLMVRAARDAKTGVEAVTVDHRLRPEAAGEAMFAAGVCESLGTGHTTLAWDHGDIPGNLMAAARRARYALIAEWAGVRGIGHVAVGHTADDQAETFLMGLARGSGLDGLSGMRPSWVQEGVVFHRPFLMQTRASLRAYLDRQGQAWIEDPTNADDRYTRIKARRVLQALHPLGITVAGLSGSIAHLSGARQALAGAALRASRDILREEAGALWIDREGLRDQAPELRRRLLLAGIGWLSGADHAPRQAKTDHLLGAVLDGRDATLGGCRFRTKGVAVLATREPRAVAGLTAAPGALWDGRWRLTGPHAPDLSIRALGPDGLKARRDWRATGLPREVLVVTPAVWRGEALVAAPAAGWPQGWTATVGPSLAATILVH